MLAALPYPETQDPSSAFTSVSVVCRSHIQVAGLPHVAELVNNFFFVHASWTIHVASERGSPRLIKIMLARETQRLADMRYIAAVCNRGIAVAAAAGQLSVLDDFILHFPGLVITDAAAAAARGGHIHIMHWLLEQQPKVCWTARVLDEAVENGHFGIVELLCNRSLVTPTHYTLEAAVTRGHVDMAEWLWVVAALEDDVISMEIALLYAKLPMAKTLWARSSKTLRISIDMAAGRGDMAFILWATAQGVSTATTAAMDRAAANGHLDVIMYLTANRAEGCTTAALDSAALHGHLPVIKWMHVNTTAQFTAEAIFNAATRGHIDILIWLDEHRGDINYPIDTFDCACGEGQLGVVMWMSAAGVGHPTHRAIDFAAANGHLDLVAWLTFNRHDGCSTDAMDRAAANGELDVVKWLHQHRQEGCTTAAMDEAASAGRLDIIKWLHWNRTEGCTVDAMANAARRGLLDIVEWLHNNRNEGCTSAAMDAAIASGDINLVEWFRVNRAEGCTERAIYGPVHNGDFEMLEYLRLRGLIESSRIAFTSAVFCNWLYIASWIDYHYGRGEVHVELQGFYRSNGWTQAILSAAFD